MMMFSLFDSVAGYWLPPTHAQSRASMIRCASDAVNSGDGNISNHPQDFGLYYVGEFNDSTGELIPAEKPELIINLGELKSEVPDVS